MTWGQIYALQSPESQAGIPKVEMARVAGVISPASAQFIVGALKKAEEDRSQVFILQLDTPGGLDQSMRTIVQAFLAARVPVVVYVSPSGSRAASAGAFITIAAHIAAMAPGTNIGAAHPVTIGEGKMDKTMAEKVTNDAAAYIKTLAEKRGRNVKWAEDAVRKSSSITEKEALRGKVIDFISKDVEELLAQMDGREVVTEAGKVTLHTKGAKVNLVEMSLRYKILAIITDPNVAYILFILGFYGIFFELSNPGSILPGIAGGIFLILAFFAFQQLPINYAGVLLILFALVLFIAEIKVASHGLLTGGGIIAMILGSLMLIETDVPGLRISWAVIIPVVLITAAFFFFAVGKGIMAQRRRPTTGSEGLVGMEGVVKLKLALVGKIMVHGELWQAEAEEEIEAGEKVRVVKVEGLKVKVERVK